MSGLEKIKKLNDNLKLIRKNGETEIEELVQKEIRDLCNLFNKENSNLVELFCIVGMGGCSFYLETKDKEFSDNDDSFNDFNDILSKFKEFDDGLNEFEDDFDNPIIIEDKINLTEEFLDKYNKLSNILKDISNNNFYNFFSLDHLDFDTREPAIYKILDNGYENNIEDESFLNLIACKNIGWKHDLSSNFYKNLKPLKGIDYNSIIESKHFHNEYEVYNSLDYKTIRNINKNLILESNLFNNTTNFKDVKIYLMNNNSNFWNNIIKFRGDNLADSNIFNILRVGLQFGKPSEIFSNEDKDVYLKNLGIYSNYPKENLNPNLSLLEQTKDYEQLKANDFFEKLINTIENLDLDKELNLFKENLKLEFKIENKSENTSFVKSFDNLEELQYYLDRINNIKFLER